MRLGDRLQLKGKRYVQRTEFIGLAHLAFRATGTKIPSDFLAIDDISLEQKSVVTTSV